MELSVNGHDYSVPEDPDTPLLTILRNDLALNGPKYGCGLGECGACTVLVDGIAARSCVIPVRGVVGRRVTTLEGLCENGGPGLVQRSFIEKQATQCGYCLNGMIMTVQGLLNRNPNPTDADIRKELKHNLCRCGAHVEIMEAVRDAVEKLHDAS